MDRAEDSQNDITWSMELKPVVGRPDANRPLDIPANATVKAHNMPFCAGDCDVAGYFPSF